jgi:transcriptional regulator
MYQPPHYREDRIEVQHALIRAHPLGLLISAGPGGLVANLIPFLVDADGSDHGTLRCHMSRANEHWRELTSVAECLVVFQGPQAYVTPSWYATKRETGKVVPTWNYATVHVRGSIAFIDDAGWLRQFVTSLTDLHEGGRSERWHVSDAPADYIEGMLRAIVGFEITVTDVLAKFKGSQNRPAADRAAVAEALRAAGRSAQEVAEIAPGTAPTGNP